MSNTKLAIIVGAIIAAIICLYFFWDVVLLLVIAAVIAFLLNPLANFLTRTFKLKKVFSVIIVVAGILAALIFVISSIMPMIIVQLKNLAASFGNIDQYYTLLIDKLQEFDLPPTFFDRLDEFIATLESTITTGIMTLVTSIVSYTAKLLDVVIVITISIYLMLDAKKMLFRLMSLFSKKIREKFASIVTQCINITWRYLRSKTIVAAIMAIATFITLSIIGVEYALLLAIIAFLLDYIPYFGSIIAGIIAAVVSLVTGSPTQALITIICVLIIQQVEGNVLTPKIQGDYVGIHPITVILSILVFNRICGPIGMFIAVPVVCIFKIFLKEVYYYLFNKSPGDARAETAASRESIQRKK